MCHFLALASPLTLSEVRSMLPAGLSVSLLPAAALAAAQRHVPGARFAAWMFRGACSCDFFLQRDADGKGDETVLRQRYRGLRAERTRVLAAIERHRRGAESRPLLLTGWQTALAAFVAEHARNAGPTLYQRQFTLEPVTTTVGDGDIQSLNAADVRARPADWITERVPTVVLP